MANSHLDPAKHPQSKEGTASTPATDVLPDGIYLFTTKTCPNCAAAKAALAREGAAYEAVDAEEQGSLSDRYGIRQAPTLLILKDGKAEKAAGVSSIIAALRALKEN